MRSFKNFFYPDLWLPDERARLGDHGRPARKARLTRIDDENDADLLIFNTCSIRDLAERKVMGKIGQLGRSPTKRAVIGVTGCMAMAKKETLFRKLPHVDFVIGTNNISDLNEVSTKSCSPANRRSAPTTNSKKISTISSPNATTPSKPLSRSSAAAINSAPTASSLIRAAKKFPAPPKASIEECAAPCPKRL